MNLLALVILSAPWSSPCPTLHPLLYSRLVRAGAYTTALQLELQNRRIGVPVWWRNPKYTHPRRTEVAK